MHKHVKIKQHALEQQIGQRRSKKKYLETNENGNMCQNLWDAEVVLRG